MIRSLLIIAFVVFVGTDNCSVATEAPPAFARFCESNGVTGVEETVDVITINADLARILLDIERDMKVVRSPQGASMNGTSGPKTIDEARGYLYEHVNMVCPPVVCTEYDNVFFFSGGTSTRPVKDFSSGFAIKKGLRPIFGWEKNRCDEIGQLAEIAAKYREIVEHREVPGGRSLSDVLCWFAKVEPQGESGLSMRLMKARTQDVKIYTGEHSWKKIGAGNTVNIRAGEKKCIWVMGISLDVGLDNAIFPVDGCPWLSNSVHTVYVRMRESSEFHNTVKVDSYVISIDQKRAYYCEGKQEVAYPFPFTNPEPDMTQEEFEKSVAARGQVEILERMRNRLVKTFGPIASYKRYSQRRRSKDGQTVIEFVTFEGSEDKMSCVTFVTAQDDKPASAALWGLDFTKQQHKLCGLLADGSIENFDVIQRTAYLEDQGDEFKRNFVKSMLKRLNLTAADLPGIDLSPILYAEH